jgi:hypothetical protein
LNSKGQLSNTAQPAKFAIKGRVLEQWLMRVAADRKENSLSTKQSAISERNAKYVNATISERITDTIDPARRNDLQTKATPYHPSVAERVFDRSDGTRANS